jgi:hypothetical protein
MTSISATVATFDASDLQLTKTDIPYENSKLQMELLATYLNKQHAGKEEHFLVQPGIVFTNTHWHGPNRNPIKKMGSETCFVIVSYTSFFFVGYDFSQNRNLNPM